MEDIEVGRDTNIYWVGSGMLVMCCCFVILGRRSRQVEEIGKVPL
jgi:hypothetical protein